ncbi:MAG: alpha-glucan family phosphorylase [Candidatus Helarchaeota archaeon]|nr:alpha-glucan family phosphorylase [Candidatus Helarchaeota archaeon]
MKIDPKIAYFSMEIGLDADIPTYSGGLGVLAGDTLKSCADLEIPIVAVTLAYNSGYFYQMLGYDGTQIERDVRWDFGAVLDKAPVTIKVNIQGKDVLVDAWVYEVIGHTGHRIPIYLLNTDIEGNEEWQKNFTRVLYDATPFQRICQEIILGIGGVKILKAMKYNNIHTFHSNEGHAAFLTLELLKDLKDVEQVRKKTVFTTHTPVPAGHDRFDYGLVNDVFRNNLLPDDIKKYAGKDQLNMTHLALYFSRYINGVSKKHSEVAQKMYPNYKINGITNGVHTVRWIHPEFADYFREALPNWKHDPSVFDRAYLLDSNEIWRIHQRIKSKLLDYEKSHSWVLMDQKLLTIGFARRVTKYKRATLILKDIDRLGKIAKGRAQLVWCGKTHPRDQDGKNIIKHIFWASEYLWDNYRVGLAFLGNYDMDLGSLITAGVDVWLNNPMRYLEASGTSGMKAAHNGVLNFSVLDGWFIEGYAMSGGMAGWKIGPKPSEPNAEINNDDADANDIYETLENEIIPTYYNKQNDWIERMKQAIRLIPYFNTHRMVNEYATQAWNLKPQPRWTTTSD